MSNLTAPTVAEVPGITLPATDDDFDQYSFVLFEVPGGIPSRIEAVSIIGNYVDTSEGQDALEVCLVSQAGNILDRQLSIVIGDETINTFFFNWVRRGNDTSQAGAASFFSGVQNNVTFWWRGALPDFVLESQGTVVLNVYRSWTGGPPELDLSGINVTYTPGGVGIAQTAAGILPLLVPTSSG